MLQWHVSVGDVVDDFDPLCEVQSDKATVEITSRYAGTIKKVGASLSRSLSPSLPCSLPPSLTLFFPLGQLYYETGDMAPTGKPLCDIECEAEEGEDLPECEAEEGEDLPECEAEEGEAAVPAAAADPQPAPAPVAAPAASVPDLSGGKVLTTPAVRRLAREHQLDLSLVPATGKGGRVLKEDVLRFIAGADSAASAGAAAGGGAAVGFAGSRGGSGAAPEDKTVEVTGIQRIMVPSLSLLPLPLSLPL